MWHYLKLSFFLLLILLASFSPHTISFLSWMKGWYEDEINYDLFFVFFFVSWTEESPRSFYGFWKIEDGIFTIVWRAPLKYGWILGKNFYCLFFNNSLLFPADIKLSESCFWHEKVFAVFMSSFAPFIPHLQMCMKIAEYLSDYANENSFYGWRLFHSFFNSRREERKKIFRFFFFLSWF